MQNISPAFVPTDSIAPLPVRSAEVVTTSAEFERPGAVSDVVNLFAHFGAASASGAYQEIHSDADAHAAAARWPLLAELLAGAKAQR